MWTILAVLFLVSYLVQPSFELQLPSAHQLPSESNHLSLSEKRHFESTQFRGQIFPHKSHGYEVILRSQKEFDFDYAELMPANTLRTKTTTLNKFKIKNVISDVQMRDKNDLVVQICELDAHQNSIGKKHIIEIPNPLKSSMKNVYYIFDMSTEQFVQVDEYELDYHKKKRSPHTKFYKNLITNCFGGASAFKDEITTDIKVFWKWLVSPDHVNNILKMLLYLGGLDKPIRISLATLKGLDLDDVLLEGIHELADWSIAKGANKKVVTFIFGPDGVVPKFIEDANVIGEESLNESKQTATLLKSIYSVADRNNGKTKAFHLLIDEVITHLENSKWDKETLAKWRTRWDEMQHVHLKKFGYVMKDVAMWFISPSHVETMIKIALYLTNMDTPFTIALDLLGAFGIDKIVEDLEVKFAQHRIDHGWNPEFINYVFGPNGIIALFLRQGHMVNDGALGHSAKADFSHIHFEFLKKLTNTVIFHRGEPFHVLVDEAILKLERWGENAVHHVVQKCHVIWHDIRVLRLKDIKDDLKNVAVWLFTPDHIVNVLKVVLTIAKLEAPISVTLHTLRAVGIEPWILKELTKSAGWMLEKCKGFRKSETVNGSLGKCEKFVLYTIGEHGIVQTFIREEAGDNEDSSEHHKLETENVFKLVKSIVHIVGINPGKGMEAIVDLVLHTLKDPLSDIKMVGSAANWARKWDKIKHEMAVIRKKELDKTGHYQCLLCGPFLKKVDRA